MSDSGQVIQVYPANIRETNEPARTVVVDPKNGAGDAADWIVFEIPPDGSAPVVGEQCSYGPHYCWWGNPEVRVHKLTWERGFNDPLSPA